MNVSLPVELFVPHSFLERFARSFGYAPVMLDPAGEIPNLVEQMKHCFCFFMTTNLMWMQQEKPFNPILGETLQGRINGQPIYIEQVEHHPAISSYYMIGNNYKLWGNHSYLTSLKLNSLIGLQQGIPHIWFSSTNKTFLYRWPNFRLSGTAMGTRKLLFIKRAFLLQPEANLVCEIVFAPDAGKSPTLKAIFGKCKVDFDDQFFGGIYTVKPGIVEEIMKCQKPYNYKLKPECIITHHSVLTGRWTQNINFDNKTYWAMNDSRRPYIFKYEKYPLPSDSRYRIDSLELRVGNSKNSQSIKEIMEVEQRKDEKNRSQGIKKLKQKK